MKLAYLTLKGGSLTEGQKKQAQSVVSELKKHFKSNRYDRERVKESLQDFRATHPTKFGEAVAYVEQALKAYFSQVEKDYPLHFASMQEDVHRARELLQGGADLFEKDDTGQTAFDIAIHRSGTEDVVELFVENVINNGQLEKLGESLAEAEFVEVRLKSRHRLTVDSVNHRVKLHEYDLVEREDAQNIFAEFLDDNHPVTSQLTEFDVSPEVEGTEYVYLNGYRSYTMSVAEATRTFPDLGQRVLFTCRLLPFGLKWAVNKLWEHSYEKGSPAVLSSFLAFAKKRLGLFHDFPEAPLWLVPTVSNL